MQSTGHLDTSGVAGFVASITKHVGFKRLAGYSVQCLYNSIVSNGSESDAVARTAYKEGAVEAVLATLKKHSHDTEVARFACGVLRLVVTSEDILTLAEEHQIFEIVAEANFKFVSAIIGTASDVESSHAATVEYSRLMAHLTQLRASSVVAAGGISQLCAVAVAESKLFTKVVAHAAKYDVLWLKDAMASSISTAQRLLMLAPEAHGALINNPDDLRNIVAAATLLHGTSSWENPQVVASFELLDAITRSEAGTAAIKELNIVSKLAPAVDVLQDSRVHANMGVAVLTRIFGRDVQQLLQTVTSGATDSATYNAKSEASFAATFLATLAVDDDIVEDALALDAVGQLTTAISTAAEAKTWALVADICKALARFAQTSGAAVDELAKAQVVDTLCMHVFATPDAHTGSPNTAVQALRLVESMIDSWDMAHHVEQAYQGVAPLMIVELLPGLSASTEVAFAVLTVLERLILHGFDVHLLNELQVMPHIANTIAAVPVADAMPLHTVCMDIIAYLAVSPEQLDVAMECNALWHGINNLNSLAAFDDALIAHTVSSMSSNISAEITSLGFGALAPSAAGAVMRALPVKAQQLCNLTRSSLYVLGTICSSDVHVQSTREWGGVNAVALGFTRFGWHPDVFQAFSEVMELLATDDEVRAAVFTTNELISAVRHRADRVGLLTVLDGRADTGSLGNMDAGWVEEGAEYTSLTAMELCDKLNDQLTTIEAVAVSSHYGLVMARAGIVPTLHRVLGVFSLLADAAKSHETSAYIATDMQDTLLRRSVRIISRLTESVATDLKRTVERSMLEDDSAAAGETAGEVEAMQKAILASGLGALNGDAVAKSVTRALSMRAVLRQFSRDAELTCAVLARGISINKEASAKSISVLVEQQAVEAVVVALRAHGFAPDVLTAASAVLCELAETSMGDTAVATRGATRFLLRNLPHFMQRVSGSSNESDILGGVQEADDQKGANAEADSERKEESDSDRAQRAAAEQKDAVRAIDGLGGLIAMLRVLYVVSDSRHGVQLLRRQGALGDLMPCLAITTRESMRLANQDRSSSDRVSGNGGDDGGNRMAKGWAIALQLLQAILTRLAEEHDVENALKEVIALSSKAGLGGVQAVRAKEAQVQALASLAGTQAAGKISKTRWTAGARATVEHIESLLAAVHDSLHGDVAEADVDDRILAVSSSLPVSITALSRLLQSGVADADEVGNSVMAVLDNVLKEESDYGTAAGLDCLGVVVEAVKDPQRLMAGLGSESQAAPLVVRLLTAASKAGDGRVVAAGLRALKAFAAHEDVSSAVHEAGAVSAVMEAMHRAEATMDAGTAEAGIAVLHCIPFDTEGVPGATAEDPMAPSLYAIIRGAIQRHCSSFGEGSVGVMTRSASLLTRLATLAEEQSSGRWMKEGDPVIRRLFRSAGTHPAYAAHRGCALSLMNLVLAACVESDTVSSYAVNTSRALLQSVGAADVIMSAVTGPEADDHLLDTGTAALEALGFVPNLTDLAAMLRRHAEKINATLALRDAAADALAEGQELEQSDDTDLVQLRTRLDIALNKLTNVARTLAVCLAMSKGIPLDTHRYVFDAVAFANEAVLSFASEEEVNEASPITPALTLLLLCTTRLCPEPGPAAAEGWYVVTPDEFVGVIAATVQQYGLIPTILVEVCVAMRALALHSGAQGVRALSNRGCLAILARLTQREWGLTGSHISESQVKAVVALAEARAGVPYDDDQDGAFQPLPVLLRATLQYVVGSAIQAVDMLQVWDDDSQQWVADVACVVDVLLASSVAAPLKRSAVVLALEASDSQDDQQQAEPKATFSTTAAEDNRLLRAAARAVGDSEGGAELLWSALRALPTASAAAAIAELTGVSNAYATHQLVTDLRVRSELLNCVRRATAANKKPLRPNGWMTFSLQSALLAGAKLLRHENSAAALAARQQAEQKQAQEDESAAVASPSNAASRWKLLRNRTKTANGDRAKLLAMAEGKGSSDAAGEEDDAETRVMERSYGTSLLTQSLHLLAGIAKAGTRTSCHADMTWALTNDDLCRVLLELIDGEGSWGPEEAAAALSVLVYTIGAPYDASGTGTGRKPSPQAVDPERVRSVAEWNVFTRVLTALSRKQMRHMPIVWNGIQMTWTAVQDSSIDVATMHLDSDALLALQSLQRVYGAKLDSQTAIMSMIEDLIALLSKVYSDQSGSAFEDLLKRFLAALENVKLCRVPSDIADVRDRSRFVPRDKINREDRHGDRDPIVKAAIAEHATADEPEDWAPLCELLPKVQKASSELQDRGVIETSPTLVAGLAEQMYDHLYDHEVATTIALALGKLSANSRNQRGCVKPSDKTQRTVVGTTVAAMHRYLEDPLMGEAAGMMVLPLSFTPQFYSVLGMAGVVDASLTALQKHLTVLSDTKLAARHRQKVEDEIARNIGRSLPIPAGQYPIIAQYCTQVVANLACDFELDSMRHAAGDIPCVQRLLDADVVNIISLVMEQYLTNPRILEDALCGISNVAFMSDEARVAIGRRSGVAIVNVIAEFGQDPNLFKMGLRAIGNLTRCDENIVRFVGAGAVSALLAGVRFNISNASICELACEVLGNLASIDTKRFKATTGATLLALTPSTSAVQAGKIALEALGSGYTPSPEFNAATRAVPGDEASTQAVVAESGLSSVVACRLVEDGAVAMVTSIVKRHATELQVVQKAMRAVFYVTSSQASAEVLIHSQVMESIVFAMRAGDYDSEVVRRAARACFRLVHHSTDVGLRSFLSSGAVALLLSAAETHSADRDASHSCYSCLGLAGTNMVDAIKKQQAVVDAAQAAGGAELEAVTLELQRWTSVQAEVMRAVQEFGAVQRATQALGLRAKDDSCLRGILLCLSCWLRDPKLASAYVTVALNGITAVLDQHDVHFDIIEEAFKALAALCLSEAALQPIVMYFGAKRLKQAVMDVGHDLMIARQLVLMIKNLLEASEDAAVVLAAQSVPAVSKGLQKYWTESCNEADLDESALKVYQEVIRELTTIVDKMSSVAVAGGSDEPEIIMPSAGSQNATTNAVRSKEARLRKMMATASATSLAISRFRRKHKERQAAGSASSPASRVPSTPTSPPGDMVDCTNLLLPGVTETMARSALNTMAQQGLDMGLWADNSYLKVKLNVRPQERHLVVSRVGKKAGEPEELPMQHVGMVINGLPTDGVGGKRRRMSLARKPKPQRAVTVTDAKGSTLIHLEAEDSFAAQTLHGALMLLAAEARLAIGLGMPVREQPRGSLAGGAGGGGGGIGALAEGDEDEED